ncbi:V-type ATP synthase subunit C [Halocatena pleomorpha]|uniref:A-type ATP synthase subunit C n=1 Tax=Halocatena pleomorpha TaxID=1785090 RepID=A0A3P3RBC4_9EURY|nr:V-type ATP synthase subunit C [Halocatena pleomorpha]RRJ30771.1 V-type ATP synthase subunit C [Halocatena pleomorpha]
MNTTVDTANYGYVTARVRVRRAALFDEDDYRKLVRMGPGEIARFMEETEYETEMNALGSRHDGVDLIEYALNRNLAKHFDDLLTFAGGELYENIARYLRKFDAWNVKTIIRGVYTDAGQQTIADDLIRAGAFSDELLDRLTESTSIEMVVEQLSNTIFGPALEAAYSDYEETDVLVPLENAIDRAFYSELLGDVPENPSEPTKLYVQLLRAEIDFRNIRNALRLARSGADIDPSEYFISGGQLFEESELEQLTTNVGQLTEYLRHSSYGSDLEGALDELEEADSLIEFERALDQALLEYTDALTNRHHLSICPVIAYIRAKEREVDNIRAIARGKEAGLTGEQIEEELVIV